MRADTSKSTGENLTGEKKTDQTSEAGGLAAPADLPACRHRAILVLGMHRSGTSAVTRLFNLLGAALPGHLMPPKADNVSGFWESEVLMEFHEKALASAGLRWDAVTRFPDAWFGSDEAREVKRQLLSILEKEFSRVPLFVVKDPRMCRLAPLWLSALDAFSAQPLPVLALRHPLEVAQSLRTRDGFSLEKSLLIWLWHFLDAERHTRGIKRSVVFYPDLLADWPAVVARVQDDLDLNFPRLHADVQAKINRFLTPGQQHHHISLEGLEGRDDIVDWVKTAYRIALAAGRGEALPVDTLDGIREALCTAEAAFGPVVGDQATALAKMERQLFTQGGEMDRLHGELDHRAEAIDHLKQECQRLNEAIAEKDGELDRRQQAISHFKQESEALHEQLGQKRLARDNHLLARIHQMEERLHQFAMRQERQQDGADWQRRLLQMTRLQLEERKRDVQRMQEALDGQARAMGNLQAKLDELGKQSPRRRTELGPLPDALADKGRIARGWFRTRRLFSRIIPFRQSSPSRQHRTVEVQIEGSGLFDRRFYLDRYPDVAEAGLDPLDHYVTYGASGERDPNPFFCARHYLQQLPEAEARPDNPLLHFITDGAARVISPHPDIDLAWYVGQHPDVTQSGMNPLLHYIRIGHPQGRPAVPPKVPVPRSPKAQLIASSCLFDTAYYTSLEPVNLDPDDDPIVHYLTVGSGAGCSPSPYFDRAYYLKTYADVAKTGIDPFFHFVKSGGIEGRNPHALFDGVYYLRQVPELSDARVNPLLHFITEGANLGLNPNPNFDVTWYLTTYPEVAESEMNPLLHYLTIGAEKGYDTAPPLTYARWIDQYDTLADSDRSMVTDQMDRLPRQPLFSVILVVPGATDRLARSSVNAVFAQIYPDWELFLVGDGLSDGPVTAIIDAPFRSDPRLRGDNAEPGETIAWQMDSAFAAARGDYLMLIEGGCRPVPHALCTLALEVNRKPSAAMLYADHDHLNAHGERCAPYFKPDWNADLFYGTPFLGTMVVVSAGLLPTLDGFRPSAAAAWMDDLVLRVSDACPVNNIVHIPHLLFHEPEADRAAARDRRDRRLPVLDDYFKRRHPGVTVAALKERYIRVTWPLPEVPPKVCLIIPTRDRKELLATCVESILQKTEYANYEVVVVDNDSQAPDAREYLRQLETRKRVRVITYAKPFNYSAINNFAVSRSNGELLCFLNNDTEVIRPDWLSEMVRQVLRKKVGVVGAKLRYPDGTIQHAGVIVGKSGVAGHALAALAGGDAGYFGRALLAQELSAVTAACLMTKRSVFESVGGFEAQPFVVSFNDIDLCLRVRKAGYRVIWDANVELIHHESATVGPPDTPDRIQQFGREVKAFRQRWRRWIENDPFYNPNLSLSNDYAWAQPPRVEKPWRCSDPAPPPVPAPRDRRLAFYAGTDNYTRSLAVTEPAVRPVAMRSFRPGLSIVILNLDQYGYIAPLLDDLVAAKTALASEPIQIEILVGDTGSVDERVLEKYDALAAAITVERELTYHFSRCNNVMFERHVKYDHTLFLNNDIIFDNAEDSLGRMLAAMQRRPHTGVLGSYLFYPDGRVQHAGVDFFREGPLRGLCYHPYHHESLPREIPVGSVTPVPAVTGACLLIRSERFVSVGGFDPGYEAECQDVALCLAARRLGDACELAQVGRIVHVENATRRSDSENWRDRSRFVRQWSSFVEAMG